MQELQKPRLIQDLEIKNSKHIYGIFECPMCKKLFKTRKTNIKNGTSTKCKSCAKTKHNLTSHNIYRTWSGIKTRVFNKKHKNFINYGAKGITICDEWKNDFIAFYDWSMKNGYKEQLSIDRIDVNGNYEPSNCRWVSRDIQQQNTRKLSLKNTTGYRGIVFKKKSNNFVSKISVNNKRIHIGCFDTALEAAKAYDTYVTQNNLEHTINGLL